jgi:hypothetical protein
MSDGCIRKEIIKLLFARIKNYFVTLFDSEIGHTNKIWEFFAVLVVNINQEQKRVLLTEIRYSACNEWSGCTNSNKQGCSSKHSAESYSSWFPSISW